MATTVTTETISQSGKVMWTVIGKIEIGSRVERNNLIMIFRLDVVSRGRGLISGKLPAGPGCNDGAPRILARVTTATFGDCKLSFCAWKGSDKALRKHTHRLLP